jgi:biofilm PGA synthesis N-glycosyltransferase PgaC
MNTHAQLHHLLDLINNSTIYWIAVVFYGLYPIATSLMWMITAFVYHVRRDSLHPAEETPDHQLPFVSVLVPAYCEGAVIGRSIEGLLAMDYPHFEVIVISDGSPDDTAERAGAYLSDPRLRLLNKRVNQGKAMALNDAIPCARGELLLVMDADAAPTDKRIAISRLRPELRVSRSPATLAQPVNSTTRADAHSSHKGLRRSPAR